MRCVHVFLPCPIPDYVLCDKCGTYKSKVIPDLKKLYDATYWSGRHSSVWQQVWNVDMHLENGISKNRFILDRIESDRGSALEIGCAPGRLLYWLKWAANFENICGIDPVDAKEIREIGHFSGKLVTGIFPDDSTEFKRESFDYIVGIDVFEHTPLPARFLKRCNMLLRDGGQLFMMFPTSDDLPLDSKHFVSDEHQYLHSKSNVEGLLTDLGFSNIHFDRWAIGHDTVSTRKV